MNILCSFVEILVDASLGLICTALIKNAYERINQKLDWDGSVKNLSN
jgi:hypothetical protein